MPQFVSHTAARFNTALAAVNEQASIVYTVTTEVVGAFDPRLKPLAVAIGEIHKRCLGVRHNKEQCLTLCDFCWNVVATIDKSVKDGLSLDDKVEHVDHLHRLLVHTAMEIQTISSHGLVKAFFKHDTIKATIVELRSQLLDGFTAFNISSLLSLQSYSAQFAVAAAEDRAHADALDDKLDGVNDKLDDIKGILGTMSPTDPIRLMQIRARMEPSGSAEQAAVFAELRNALREQGDPPLPLADIIDEAETVGKLPVSDGPNGKLWRGILLRDPKMGLAIKYPREMHTLSLNRAREFHRSVEIQRGLKHRNIIPLMGVKYKQVGDAFAIDFIAFPWAEYGSISSFLAKFPTANRLKLMLDVACGLKYLHNQSPPIVHRAIEPSHILVDAERTAIISNFSVAKTLDSLDSTTYTVSDGAQKSLRWMAPEISDGECDRPADVYSWAITAINIFSGLDPFVGTKQHGGVVLAVSRGLRPDRKKHPSPVITDEVWNLLERCWHQDPAKRPTMDDVVDEITTTMRLDFSAV